MLDRSCKFDHLCQQDEKSMTSIDSVIHVQPFRTAQEFLLDGNAIIELELIRT